MRSLFKTLGILSVFALLFSFPTISHAAKQAIPAVEDGMSEGDFALWLVHAIGAVKVQEAGPIIQPAGRVPGHLPPGLRSQDAIEFLWGNLGVQVDGDWKRNAPLTKEKLASMLAGCELSKEDKAKVDDLVKNDDPNDKNKNFQLLANMVRDCVQSAYNNAKKGVFRVHAATPYLPPV